MQFDISSRQTNDELRHVTQVYPFPEIRAAAGIDVTDKGRTQPALIICFGDTQDAAESLAARVFAALEYAHENQSAQITPGGES